MWRLLDQAEFRFTTGFVGVFLVEPFVDVAFLPRELFENCCEAYAQACKPRSRMDWIAFAEKMPRDAMTCPSEMIDKISVRD